MINKLLMPKAYVEVLKILKYLPENDYKKIPNEIITNMKLKSDKEYKFEVTSFDNFQEQTMLKETEAILAVLFRDYLATQEQRKKILDKERVDFNKSENAKKEKYSSDNIFNNKTKNIIDNYCISSNKNTQEIDLIKYRESLFIKIRILLMKLFHLKK